MTSNVGIIYEKLKTYQSKDKFEMFAECVRNKLDTHLTDYYYRLSAKLDKAYNKVISIDDARVLKEVNKHLNKADYK